MSEPLLNINNLSVQYGRFLAVDDISFSLAAGELLGMIGPNGAGKTTILRTCAGLQAPTSGRVEVMGHDVHKHATIVGHHLGFTPDTPSVYDALTVENFLYFIGRCYRLSEALVEDRIDLWLDQLWLKDKRTSKISALSRGMKQRLAVLRTLLPDPHVVLLDEPAAGLDPAGRMYFRRLLASLREQGKAIIVSSHILADLAEYCTHVLIMERGRIRNFGTVAHVAGGAAADRCTYRITLARPLGDVAARLATIAEIRPLSVGTERIDIEHASDRDAAAGLLRDLIAAGLPVASFHPLSPDLEQAYLRSGIGQVD